MTIRRISTRTEVTGRIPFLRKSREVPDERVLEPGYRENILIGSRPMSQGSGSVEYYPRTLVVESDNSVLLTEPISVGDSRFIGRGPSSKRIEGEQINLFLRDSYVSATPKTDPDKGPKKYVEFEWEPDLPPQSRR